MTRTTYDDIREEVVSCADRTMLDKLDEYKTMYRPLINSARTTSRINSFRELVAVLVKRRCLAEDKMSILHDIASSLRDSTIVVRVKEYELKIPADNARGYVAVSGSSAKVARLDRKVKTVVRNKPQQAVRPHEQLWYNPHPCEPPQYLGYWPTAPDYVPRLPAGVVEHISEELGSAWKSFARLVAVKEGEIDDLITSTDMSIKEKLVKCLELFEKRTRPVDIRKALHVALCKVRRNDVSEQIEQMLIQAGF
ncbi:hypothetical protein PR048_033028 [Dryococelus australis]|uniref:Death domain-containing protein n=1 Tax=Dryococelus australis TaxID=614101 RepID=A0ABQ9G808_9NEOP|nr:hypothetical protein PR048_033028 [Dryococelus australis]